jgi:hypothetical protein
MMKAAGIPEDHIVEETSPYMPKNLITRRGGRERAGPCRARIIGLRLRDGEVRPCIIMPVGISPGLRICDDKVICE